MGLTKEEKKALKLAKKLEKARVAAETTKTRKREQLDRELTAHELQHAELGKRMQMLMIKAKEPVYKQNIEVMWRTFNRTIDKKDHLINLMMHLRRVADKQYQRTISNFCEVVDGIINTFLEDLETMCKEANKKIEALIKQGQEERDYILEYQKNAETHLSILLYHSHELADSLAWTIRGENFVKIGEDTSRYLEIREDLHWLLAGDYTNMWEQFKGTLKSYISGTSENQKQVRILRKKENMMVDIIASQAKKIIASEASIRRLRIELVAYESGEKQAEFRDRRKRHKIACIKLKQHFMEGVDRDERQLDKLVMMSNISVQHLEIACKKGEKILRVAGICRKLETQREKVIPFGTAAPYEVEKLPVHSKKNGRWKKSEEALVANALATTCGLTRLWQRISKADLSKRALYREKMLLEQENAALTQLLNLKGEGKLSAQTIKCPCVLKSSKRSIYQPHAVDGNLEAIKILRYY